MKYEDFRQKVAKLPYFRSNIFCHLTEKTDLLRSQLASWVKKGRVIELKRGVYTLSDQDRSVGLSVLSLSQILYPPSYISLEYALSYYQLIPERVTSVTSITSKKTQAFNNLLGHFSYRHIKLNCFTGFVQNKDEFGHFYFMATAEKALVDTLYFHLRGIAKIDAAWFHESLRLQNSNILDQKKLQQYADLFQQKKLSAYIDLLEHFDD